MKIGDFARAARTTPRTVRHYHSLGLLPEPRRLANGYREYELADLLRLMRSGWLARAGVPLGRIGEMLAAEDSDGTDRLRHDLSVVIATLDAERDRLTRQLAALRDVDRALADGRRLSPLPGELDDALSTVAAAAGTEAERALVETEREMLEVLALSGDLPPAIVDGYRQLAVEPRRLADAMGMLAEFADLSGQPVAASDARITALAHRLAADPLVVQMLAGADPPGALPDDEAAFFLPDPAQREVVRRLFAML